MKKEESLCLDLFKPLTRTERQTEALRSWIEHKCVGSFVHCTAFGKTTEGIRAIEILMKKFPNLSVIVVVPTEGLQQQWIKLLDAAGLSLNCNVYIINTVIKNTYSCDLIILDELHRFASSTFVNVFKCVKYKFLLGLTATLERLDGKHELLEKYCPVVDKVTYVEAVASGWLSESVEYKIVLNVEDINKYEELTKQFNKHFEFFGFSFDDAMRCLGKEGYKFRNQYTNALLQLDPSRDRSETYKEVTYHSMELSRVLQQRKKFINEHPDKIRLTREIIKHRPEAKIITFSATIDIAESIGVGYVYSSKQTKKKNKMTLEEFASMETGVLNASRKADEGLDIRGINTLIILGQDSSPTRYTQRKGRSVRKEGNKIAEIFVFVIADTVEDKWFVKSHENDSSKVIAVDEENLMHILRGEEYKEYKRPLKQFSFRF